MPLSINTNIASLTAQRAMLNTGRELETAFERLSTGKRINTAVDDAAGLAIAERLTGRIRLLKVRKTRLQLSFSASETWQSKEQTVR
jgi:flagellin